MASPVVTDLRGPVLSELKVTKEDEFDIEPPVAVKIARVVWRFIVDFVSVGTALFGAWIASSIAAYLNGPIWLVAIAGALFGLVLPLLLEVWHRLDRERYGETDEDHPWVGHRILRNALLVNVAFIVGLLFLYARGAYNAVTTRGDWIIESSASELAGWARARLFALVDKADSLFDRSDDPYAGFDDSYKFEPLYVGWREEPLPAREGPRPEPPTKPTKRESPSTKATEKPAKPAKESPPPKISRPPSESPTPKIPDKPTPSRLPERPTLDQPAEHRRERPAREPTRESEEPIPERKKPPESPKTEFPTVPTDREQPEEVGVDEDGVPLIKIHGDEEPTIRQRETPSKAQPTKPAAPPPPVTPLPRPRAYVRWLADARPSPLVSSMPPEAKASYETVAAFIAENENDPFERVKAIHDFVATTTRYIVTDDLDSLPASDPDAVFRDKAAVCAGYARLFQAMIEAVGGRAVYISGDARFSDGSVPGTSHAWNAVEILGQWYLVDVTWDAGHVDGGRFIESYRTDHLLAPPDIFGMTHFPRDARWQLVEEPLSRGEFMRQPLLLPRFFAYGFDLVEPSRSQTTVEGSVRVVIDNPKGHSVLVAFQAQPRAEQTRCTQNDEPKRSIAHCYFPGAGTYPVSAFAAYRGQSRHEQVARFEIQSR
ncbi:MAG: hypothetical protein HY791_19145 [Deltaproteobacteria bacterium]|nr:hypothetical protein [Deltaproteobacteria bacterium]